MERGYDGHLQTAQQMQNMASRRATEDSILVLQAHHVDVVEVQEFSSLLIRLDLILSQRPPHPGGIVIILIGVVDWKRQQSGTPVLCGYCAAQVCGEGSDSALSWKIVPDYCNSTRQRGPRLQSRCCIAPYQRPRTHDLQEWLSQQCVW